MFAECLNVQCEWSGSSGSCRDGKLCPKCGGLVRLDTSLTNPGQARDDLLIFNTSNQAIIMSALAMLVSNAAIGFAKGDPVRVKFESHAKNLLEYAATTNSVVTSIAPILENANKWEGNVL